VEDKREHLLAVARMQNRKRVVASASAELAEHRVRLHRKQAAANCTWRNQAVIVFG
jgi:hypothetical protein